MNIKVFSVDVYFQQYCRRIANKDSSALYNFYFIVRLSVLKTYHSASHLQLTIIVLQLRSCLKLSTLLLLSDFLMDENVINY